MVISARQAETIMETVNDAVAKTCHGRRLCDLEEIQSDIYAITYERLEKKKGEWTDDRLQRYVRRTARFESIKAFKRRSRDRLYIGELYPLEQEFPAPIARTCSDIELISLLNFLPERERLAVMCFFGFTELVYPFRDFYYRKDRGVAMLKSTLGGVRV